MGMLSLAGIVSGAGAGAGKSLRQSQTYLNWEMLQEERGKLELQRDERINERHIMTENRHRAQAEADLEKSQSEPFLERQAKADATLAELKLENRRKLRPLMTAERVAEGKAEQEIYGELRDKQMEVAQQRQDDAWALDQRHAEHLLQVTANNLKNPVNLEIYELTLRQAAVVQGYADRAMVDRSQRLHEHPEIALAYRNVSNLTQTQAQQLALEDLQFKAEHRSEDYAAVQRKQLMDVKDHESNRISHLLTSSDRALEALSKSIGASVNDVEKTSLNARYSAELQLNKDIAARARQIYGLRPARVAPELKGPPPASTPAHKTDPFLADNGGLFTSPFDSQ